MNKSIVMSVELSLPIPPSLNASYRNVHINGSNRTLLSKVAREYKKAVAWTVAAQKIQSFGKKRLEVRYRFSYPDKRRRDLANSEKILTDTLEGLLFDNDSQIDRMILERGEIDRINPRVDVEIVEI